MAKAYGLSKPPESTDVNSWVFKRWLDELMEMFLSTILLKTVTTTYTVEADKFYIRGDATAGIFTITLPAALNSQGRQLLLKKIDSGGNDITISRAGSDTIEGSNTLTLGAQWDKYHLISNGVDTWEIM